MRYLELSLSPGTRQIHPLFPVLTDSPFVDVAWMLDWNVTRRETSTVLFRVEGDPDPLAEALDREPVVIDAEITPLDERSCYANIHSETTDTEWELWRAFTQERSLLVPPLEYSSDGTVTSRIVGTMDELRAALADVPDGIEATVERLGEFQGPPTDTPSVLTDRQEAVVRAALEVGYYEVPREATAADVARKVDCSPSTASEHLRKAESRLVDAFVAR